jgi:hypothetical protein
MYRVRLLLALAVTAAMTASVFLSAGPAGAVRHQEAADSVCSLLSRPDVMSQISAAGEVALKVRCGLIAPDAPGSPSAINGRPERLVNDRSTDTWTHITQSETTVAISGSTVLAGWNDSGEFNPNGDFSGYGRSTDRGNTWTDMRTPTTPLGPVSAVFGDPVLMADLDRNPGDAGVFYFSNLGDSSGNPIISVHKTTDGGQTWDSAANASPAAPAFTFPDKEWLAVDSRPSGTGAGNVYVCYRLFGGGDGIRFSRSTNGGATFTELPASISANPIETQGCWVAVNPTNGHVYVAWRNTSTVPLTMRFRRSIDGGLTFEPEITIGQFPAPENNTSACGRTAFVDDEPNASQRAIRSGSFPQIAVDPNTGNIALVAHSAGLAGGSESDIAYTTSTNGGTTWSAPVRVNNVVTGQQFFGGIAVNRDGKLRAMFYSTQNSPSDRLIDVYISSSNDWGVTWSGPRRVTEVSFDRPVTNPNFDTFVVSCYMGDYNQIQSPPPGLGRGQFWVSWGDNRLDGNPNQAGIQPDPDVRIERQRRDFLSPASPGQ